jgi:hypothetical protein
MFCDFNEIKREIPLSEEDSTIVEIVVKHFFSGEVLFRFSHPHKMIDIYLKKYNIPLSVLRSTELDYLYILRPSPIDNFVFFGESEEFVFAQAELFLMMHNGENTTLH